MIAQKSVNIWKHTVPLLDTQTSQRNPKGNVPGIKSNENRMSACA